MERTNLFVLLLIIAILAITVFLMITVPLLTTLSYGVSTVNGVECNTAYDLQHRWQMDLDTMKMTFVNMSLPTCLEVKAEQLYGITKENSAVGYAVFGDHDE